LHGDEKINAADITATASIHEERRLFYVGMTRAQDSLILTSSVTRPIFGSYQSRPVSRFVSEIPESLCEQIKQKVYSAIIIVFSSLLIALLLAALIQKLISKPILNLANSIKEISNSKNYEMRVESSTNDEIGFVIGHFNEMLDKIQNRDKVY